MNLLSEPMMVFSPSSHSPVQKIQQYVLTSYSNSRELFGSVRLINSEATDHIGFVARLCGLACLPQLFTPTDVKPHSR